ncbi:hypothetical protein Hamer_G005806 [Homarus americanus]|uniref:Uncharacterized protein n=1 Tax=Homarus americanus TaxID=6706 RepID=A0A8J5JJU9_HOMAM|nr:hypothetical protein Hamer_G005806 [Homarus americanus]
MYCMCRRACQAKIDCHSVSMVPTTGTENECRISTKPANIGDKTQRPRLKRTPGAFHFLAAVKGTNEWITLLDDGFKWRTESNTYIWSFRLNGARLAILSSLHQVKLAMRDTTVNKPYYVDLSRTGTDQPVWNAGGGNVKYNDTDLDPTRIQDDPNLSNSKFYFTHDDHAGVDVVDLALTSLADITDLALTSLSDITDLALTSLADITDLALTSLADITDLALTSLADITDLALTSLADITDLALTSLADITDRALSSSGGEGQVSNVCQGGEGQVSNVCQGGEGQVNNVYSGVVLGSSETSHVVVKQ